VGRDRTGLPVSAAADAPLSPTLARPFVRVCARTDFPCPHAMRTSRSLTCRPPARRHPPLSVNSATDIPPRNLPRECAQQQLPLLAASGEPVAHSSALAALCTRTTAPHRTAPLSDECRCSTTSRCTSRRTRRSCTRRHTAPACLTSTTMWCAFASAALRTRLRLSVRSVMRVRVRARERAVVCGQCVCVGVWGGGAGGISHVQVQELAAVFGIAIANEPRAFAPNGPLFQLLLLPTNDVPCCCRSRLRRRVAAVAACLPACRVVRRGA
jgi:hypothetical protein